MVKVINPVFNPYVNDSRVIEESVSLANCGYEVEVIAHPDKGLSRYSKAREFLVKRFAKKYSKSKSYLQL